MRAIFIVLSLLFCFSIYASCVDELRLTGLEVEKLRRKTGLFYVQNKSGQFVPSGQLLYQPKKIYTIQYFDNHFGEYHRQYLEYYTYDRLKNYLNMNANKFKKLGYEKKVIGKSVKGNDLFVLMPKKIDISKKTHVIFGRHHGDEGTANWIIEGFLNKSLHLKNQNWLRDNQVIVYPMINPDGAIVQTRYNANGYDLNREWRVSPGDEVDEVKTIHTHLRRFLNKLQSVPVLLDMHGSKTQDFVYRVKKYFFSRSYFNMQQSFIDRLGVYDIWQNGRYKLSNGSEGMARIVLGRQGFNMLTHETIKNISIFNNRTTNTLKSQGHAIYNSIVDLY